MTVPRDTPAAIITGASSGIGLAAARALGARGFALTLCGRRPEKLAEAVQALEAEGLEVQGIAGALQQEEEVRRVVRLHSERYGRLDVLVNNAGVGIGSRVGATATKHLDLQLDLNLRATILFYREALDLLRAAASEHGSALIVNTASITAKFGEAGLAVYAATKAAVVNWTESMHLELSADGIKSTALCPGFVDTPMTDWAKESVSVEQMIRPEDVASAIPFLLDLSPTCCVPEIQFVRPGHRTS